MDSNGILQHIQERQDAYEDDMNALRGQIGSLVMSIEGLTSKIDGLIMLHEKVVKWLLIVVCAIALGKGMFDILEKFAK